MADPKGLLVVPVAYRADSSLHALELDDSDRLKVLLDAATGALTVTQTDPASLLVGPHGWISGAWKKAPLPFGYSAKVDEHVGSLTLAAGVNTFDTTAVPAGYVDVITHIAMRYTGTVPTSILCFFTAIANLKPIYTQAAPVSGAVYDHQGWWVLAAGDLIEFRVIGATLNDDFDGFISGFRVAINQ